MNIVKVNKKIILFDDSNNEVGFISIYQRKSILYVHSTQVYQEYQGKGYASILASYLVDYAKNNNLKIKSSCSYISSYLTKHQ